MIKIPTVNLLVSADIDAVKGQMSNADAIQALKQNKDTWLFKNIGNPNFLSLTHAIGAGGGKNVAITLEFLDPKNEFEERFMQTSFPQKIDSFFNLDESNESVAEISKLAATDKEGFKAEKSEAARKLIGQFSGTMAGAAKSFQSQQAKLGARRFVVAYGVGQDLRTWAGPFVGLLVNAEYDYKANGSKILKIDIIADSSQFLEGGGSPHLPEGAQRVDCQGYSDPILLSQKGGKHPDADEPSKKTGYKPQTEEVGPSSNCTEVMYVSVKPIHDIVDQAILRYVESATHLPGNVLLLLPNLDDIFKEQVQVSKDALPEIGPGCEDNAVPEALAALVTANNTVLCDLGFTLQEMPKGDQTKNETTDTLDVKKQEEFDDAICAFQHQLESTNALAQISSQGSPNFHAPLKKILDNITKAAADKYALEFDYFFENNLQVLKFWKEQGIISDDGIAAFVIGEKRLIHTFLYPPVSVYAQPPEYATNDNYDTFHGGYQSKMRELSHKPYNDYDFSFGNPSVVSDEFALTPGSEAASEVEKSNIPVFKSGVPNSNILSLNFKDNNLYFTMLNFASHQQVTTALKSGMKKAITTTYAKDIQNIKKAISNWLDDEGADAIQSLAQELDPQFAEAAKQAGVDDVAAVLLNGMKSDKRKGELSVELLPQEAKNPAQLALSMLQYWYSLAVNISITSLPMFHISNISNLNKKALVFIKEPQMMGINQDPDQALTRKWLSGLYRMYGFKHIISGKKVESSFELTRIPVKSEWT